MTNLENHVLLRRQLHEFAGLRGVVRNWFFDQHMFTLRKERPRHVVVCVGRRGHRSGIDCLDELINGFRRRCAKFSPDRVCFEKIDIVHGRKLSRWNFGVEPGMVASDMADSHNANARFLHRHRVFSAGDIFQKPVVGLRDALAKGDRRLPAKSAQLGGVEQLSRCAIWFGRIPNKFTIESDNVTDQLRKFADGDVLAPPNIDNFGRIIFLEEKQARRGKIGHM